MKIRKPLALGLVSGLALSVFAVAVPAFADPVSNSYVLVGSDTLQDSANAIVNGTTITGTPVQVLANGATLGNFDAFPKNSKIQTKPAGPYFLRPSGSGNGRNALISSITGAPWNGVDITGQVDIARSSSGPGGNANSAGKLVYYPYARDAVSYAYYGTGNELNALTTAQLKTIYESDDDVTINGVVVKPLLPQSGSGTRDFFLSAIGVTTLGSTVNTKGDTLPENDGSQLTAAGQIVPFSVASWVAQSNNAAPNTIPGSGNVKLGSTNSIAPYTGSGTSLVPASAYYATSYGRDTYLIVEYARVEVGNAKYDATLASLLDRTLPASLTNFGASSTTVGAVKKKFGFLAPSSTDPIRAYATI